MACNWIDVVCWCDLCLLSKRKVSFLMSASVFFWISIILRRQCHILDMFKHPYVKQEVSFAVTALHMKNVSCLFFSWRFEQSVSSHAQNFTVSLQHIRWNATKLSRLHVSTNLHVLNDTFSFDSFKQGKHRNNSRTVMNCNVSQNARCASRSAVRHW